MKLCIAKTVAVASLLTGTAQADIPVAYDVIELGALERVVQQDGSRTRQSSYGYSVNNNGDYVGHSQGKHTVINEREVNGVIIREEATLDLLQPVDFTDLNRTITPEDRELGFGTTTSTIGIFATSVNEQGIISGYGFDNELFPVFNPEESCVESGESRRELRRGYYFDLTDTLTQIPATFVPGAPLGTEPEYIGSAVLGANDDYLVGYGEQITEKDECGNIQTIVNRGMIYNLNDSTAEFVGVLEDSENSLQANSVIRSINAANQFVGWSNQLLDEERVAKGIIGTVGSETLTEVSGLEGAENAFLWDIDNNGQYAVGSSTKAANLVLPTAFYYDIDQQQSVEIGYLSNQFQNSEALSVNTQNLVVGVSQISQSPGNFSAFIYDIDGTGEMVDLNKLIDCDAGWTLNEAREINDNGWIIGTGSVLVEQEDGSMLGEVRGFLLQPRTTAPDRSCDEETSSDSGGSLPPVAIILFALLGLRNRFQG